MNYSELVKHVNKITKGPALTRKQKKEMFKISADRLNVSINKYWGKLIAQIAVEKYLKSKSLSALNTEK